MMWKDYPNYRFEPKTELLIYDYAAITVRLSLFGELYSGYNVAYLPEHKVRAFLKLAHKAIGKIYETQR